MSVAVLTDRRARILTTPEGIALPVRIASRGARAGALMIDFMLIHGLMLLLTALLLYLGIGVLGLALEGEGEAGGALEFLAVLWIIFMFLFRNAYFLFFELGPRGATPGKRMAGIRIAARDGGRLRAEAVIARNLLRDIELFLPLVMIAGAQSGDGGLAGLAGAAWFALFMLFPFFNRDVLRAGDLVAGTWVLEAPRVRLGQVLAVTGTDYQFSDEQLSLYGAYELQTLEQILRSGRESTLAPVAETIRQKIGWTGRADDDKAFLEAFYARMRARLERDMRFGKRKADKHS